MENPINMDDLGGFSHIFGSTPKLTWGGYFLPSIGSGRVKNLGDLAWPFGGFSPFFCVKMVRTPRKHEPTYQKNTILGLDIEIYASISPIAISL